MAGREQFANNYATILNGSIDNSQTTLTLTSATGAPAAPFRIIIDSEIILVGARTTTACSACVRGADGTAAASHADLAPVTHVLTAAGLSAAADYGVCQGRLTLTTAVPVTTADVTAATTLYFTPFRGNLIGLFDGTVWKTYAFTEQSITLASLTAALPYDVFIVDSTLALELVAWTNTTTRATALVTQDGILCKSGALTRRYLGTICITATTGQCEDSVAHRLVWNYYNRLLRPLKVFDSTDQWNYAIATWRAANGTTTNHRLDYMCGVSEDIVACRVGANSGVSGAIAGSVGIGIDSTSVNSADIFSEMVNTATGLQKAEYRGFPGIGYHTLTWLEYARAGTVSFQGDAGVADQQSGILAEVWG